MENWLRLDSVCAILHALTNRLFLANIPGKYGNIINYVQMAEVVYDFVKPYTEQI